MGSFKFVLPDCSRYVAGDKLLITGKLDSSIDKMISGQISLTVQSIKQFESNVISGKSLFLFIEQKITSFKTYIKKRAADFLSPDAFALFASLLFGEKNFFRSSFKTNVVRLHVTSFIALNAYALTILETLLFTQPKFFVPRRFWGLLLVPFVFIFFIFSNYSLVVLRILVTTTLFAIGLFCRQQLSSRGIFYSSVGALLLINPFFIYNLSFQFSVMTLFGIFLWQSLIQKCLFKVRWLRKKTLRATIAKKGLSILGMSLAAQSFVLPLIFYHFGEYDFASFVAHFVLFFFIPVLVIANFGYVLAIFFPPFDALMVGFMNFLSLIFAESLGFLCKLSGMIVWKLSLSVPEIGILWLCLFCVWFLAKSVVFSKKPSF